MYDKYLGSILKPGDAVAVLPNGSALPGDVLEIAKVNRVGSVAIQLTDGRNFATIGGGSLDIPKRGHIVPATDAHRAALRSKFVSSKRPDFSAA